MDNSSPYQAPASPPPPMPHPGLIEPPAVKAFGVMHLVLAGLGFLMALWSLLSPLINRAMMANTPGYAAQEKFQQDLLWVTLMTAVFMLALAVLLLISGLKLVRSRPDGVKWSHRYAWTSIATKMISLVVTLVWVLPKTQQFVGDAMSAAPGSKPPEAFAAVMKGVVAASSVATPVIACIYPALALYFLSRPAVKAWCAARLPGAA